MTELLNKSEYAARAQGLQLPTSAFVNGEPYRAVSGGTFTTFNPATGQALAELPSCAAEDVDIAVANARAAFDDGRWSKQHPSARRPCCCAWPR